MASIISAGTTSGTALNMTADTSGQLQLATGASATTAVTIDTSQNVGIGTTSPSCPLTVKSRTADNIGLRVLQSSNNIGQIQFTNDPVTTEWASFSATSTYLGISSLGYQAFYTNSAERMRIDTSGNLLVGTTSTNPIASRVNGFTTGPVGFITLRGANNMALGLSGTSGNHIAFYTDNGTTYVSAGTISSNGSTTSYNATSDYRLKDNVQPLTNALNRITQLRPVTWTWKEGHGGTQPNCEGFIAHELQSILPVAVTGEKDAMDKDGKPIYQGVDTSFLVATLTAAIQEQTIIINDLKARITALEGAKS